jgi:hypothetical protein
MLFKEKYEQLVNSKFNYNSEFENDLIIKFLGSNINTDQFYIISTSNNNNIQDIIITVKIISRKFGWHKTKETVKYYNINNILLFFNLYNSLINFKYDINNKIGVEFRGSSKEKLVDFIEILKSEYISYITKI